MNEVDADQSLGVDTMRSNIWRVSRDRGRGEMVVGLEEIHAGIYILRWVMRRVSDIGEQGVSRGQGRWIGSP